MTKKTIEQWAEDLRDWTAAVSMAAEEQFLMRKKVARVAARIIIGEALFAGDVAAGATKESVAAAAGLLAIAEHMASSIVPVDGAVTDESRAYVERFVAECCRESGVAYVDTARAIVRLLVLTPRSALTRRDAEELVRALSAHPGDGSLRDAVCRAIRVRAEAAGYAAPGCAGAEPVAPAVGRH